MKETLEIRGHTIEVKRWNYGEKQRALRKATKWISVKGGRQGELDADVDPWGLNDQMVLICVKKWDLLDPETDKPLPITLEALHKVEPPEIIEDLVTELQRINGVSVEERKKS